MCTYDDANVCFMHACLLGGRCLGRRCRVLLKHPGILCGGCVCQRAIAAKKTKQIKQQQNNCITFVHLFPMFQLLYYLAHLHSFIYLLMWHFCYTEHVSFIVEQLCWVFLNNHFIDIYPVLYDYYYFGRA